MSPKSGRYDKLCEQILKDQDANMVTLIVVNGKHGHGMSVCIKGEEHLAKEMSEKFPDLLRKMADMIEHEGRFGPGPSSTTSSWTDLEEGGRDE